jgi:hypothetical protein
MSHMTLFDPTTTIRAKKTRIVQNCIKMNSSTNNQDDGKNTGLKNDTNLEVINLSEVSIYLHNWVMPLILSISFLDSPVNQNTYKA